MDLLSAFFAAGFIVPLLDWGVTTRLGDKQGFDYLYWPLPRARLVSLLIWMLATFIAVGFGHPRSAHPATWALPLLCPAAAIWAIVAVYDVTRQGKAEDSRSYSDPRD